MINSYAQLWVPENRWGSVKRNARLTGSVMPSLDGYLLIKANIEASLIGGIANNHPTTRVSFCNLNNGHDIGVFVAELLPNTAYRRNVFMSTYKPTQEERRSMLNPRSIEENPLLVGICAESTIEVPADPKQGIDKFVSSAYQAWPFMMLIRGQEPIFYATQKSLNHSSS